MSSYEMENETLVNEIQLLEKKVTDLRNNHDRLTNSYSIAVKRGSAAYTSSTLQLSNRHVELDKLYMENLHRLTGITAFRIPNFDGFGIRFEMFSNCKFQEPHYIILRYHEKKYEIYRHTIPAHIPLKLDKNIKKFVKSVRRELAKHNNKLQLLSQDLPNVQNVEYDKAIRLIKLQFTNTFHAYLFCHNMTITKVTSDNNNNNNNIESILVGPLITLKDRLTFMDFQIS